MCLLSSPDWDVFISCQLPYAGSVTEEGAGASVPPDSLKKRKMTLPSGCLSGLVPASWLLSGIQRFVAQRGATFEPDNGVVGSC